MRKFISMLLAVLMLGALAIPAMAAAEPEGDSPFVSTDTTELDSKTTGVTVEAYTEGDADALVAGALAAAKETEADYSGAIAVEVLKDGKGTDESVTCVIAYSSETDHVAKIMYQHDNVWYEASFTYLGNGQYQVTFGEGLSPVVLLLEAGPAKEPTNNSNNSSSSKAPTSPKTGYD